MATGVKAQNIVVYDCDHSMDMALVQPGQDRAIRTMRRSFASNFISIPDNSLINLCALNDHQSAGVTLAWESLSPSLVNKVTAVTPVFP